MSPFDAVVRRRRMTRSFRPDPIDPSVVADLVGHLKQLGHKVTIHDPLADPNEAQHEYGVMLAPTLEGLNGFAAIIAAVPHQAYRALTPEAIADLLQPGGIVVLDDFVPSVHWPPIVDGQVDVVREQWLTDERFAAKPERERFDTHTRAEIDALIGWDRGTHGD